MPITYKKEIQTRYAAAALVAHGRAVAAPKSDAAAFYLFAIGGVLASFAIVWSAV